MDNKSIDQVAIIVLNYKAIDDTLTCIKSLAEQSYTNLHILAIENGSRDGSAGTLKQFEKTTDIENFSVLYNKKNLGFAGGSNSGLAWARQNNFKYIAFFNNDATADRNWLASLVDTIKEDANYGSVTGLLLKNDGKLIDSTAEQYSIWGLAFPTNRNKKVEAAPKEKQLIFGATGGATLHRIEMLNQIGSFDDVYFAYYEDIDLSFRAQLTGWKVVYTPNAIAYHKIGATSKKIPGFTTQQTFRNLPLLFIKNVPRELFFQIGCRLFLAYMLMLCKAIVKGAGIPAIKGCLKGIVLFWSRGIPARRNIQSMRKVPVSYIKSMLWPDLPPDQTGIRKLRKFFTGRP